MLRTETMKNHFFLPVLNWKTPADDLEFLVDFNNLKLLLYLLVEETLLSKGSCRVLATAHLEENSLRVQSKDLPLPMSMEGLVKD